MSGGATLAHGGYALRSYEYARTMTGSPRVRLVWSRVTTREENKFRGYYGGYSTVTISYKIS